MKKFQPVKTQRYFKAPSMESKSYGIQIDYKPVTPKIANRKVNDKKIDKLGIISQVLISIS